LAAEGMTELSGVFPSGAERCQLVLAADRFTLDDRLPSVRPKAKPLTVRLSLGAGAGDAAEFFKKVFAGVDGVEFSPVLNAALRVVTEDGNWKTPKGAAIVLAQNEAGEKAGEATPKLSREPVVAERHALVADLNWQGLLGPGAGRLVAEPADEVLLWQAGRPLAWMRSGGANQGGQLVLNFDWAAGNASRLPATVLLVRRFLAQVQAMQPGAYAANFDARAPVPLAEADWVSAKGEGLVMETEPSGPEAASAVVKRPLATTEVAVLRAPGVAGFFNVRRGSQVLVKGAAQFADVRQGDFRAAERFVIPPPAGAEAAARERAQRGDPFASLWLALAGAALLTSWWPKREGGRVA